MYNIRRKYGQFQGISASEAVIYEVFLNDQKHVFATRSVRSPCMMKHSFVTVTSKRIISSLLYLQAIRFQEYGHTWKSLGCLSHCDWKQKINERFLFVISRLSTWHEIENSCHKTEYFHNIILFKDMSWQVISILDNCNDNKMNKMYTIRVIFLTCNTDSASIMLI